MLWAMVMMGPVRARRQYHPSVPTGSRALVDQHYLDIDILIGQFLRFSPDGCQPRLGR